jgi:DME family drug/metabolite transporter
VWVARRLSLVDSVVATLHMGIVATIVLTAVAVLGDGLAFPGVVSGWVGLVLVACLQTLCLPLFYMAMSRIGVVKAGMVSNVQPLVSIIAAFAIFGEMLTATQLLGGLMVLAGIWLMQAGDRIER